MLKLENGHTFKIETINQKEQNVYVSRVLLNGRPLTRRYITHGEIMGGGKLEFYMTDVPRKR
jgi:putative alpha-1,2-mannosidase